MARRLKSASRVVFPDPKTASAEGIVAVGAAPDPDILKDAYRRGIFPWPHEGYPLLWFSPDPRFVLEPHKAHLHKSLRKVMKKTSVVVKADTAFRAVIESCSAKKRPNQRGTWITDAMVEGYCALNDEGVAHSIEAWQPGPGGETLVGGLYGISFGSVFYGESMFQTQADASKIAFGTLLGNLVKWGFDLVDCQSYTDHLARFGAVHWPRARFLDALARCLQAPTREGKWTLELTPAAATDLVTAPMPEGSADSEHEDRE